MVLILPQDHEDSEYVLSFEIGQREIGFYSERITEPSIIVLVYRYKSPSFDMKLYKYIHIVMYMYNNIYIT